MLVDPFEPDLVHSQKGPGPGLPYPSEVFAFLVPNCAKTEVTHLRVEHNHPGSSFSFFSLSLLILSNMSLIIDYVHTQKYNKYE